MKTIFAIFLSFFFVTAASAAPTAEQIARAAAILAESPAASAPAPAAAPGPSTATIANEWVDVGKNIGSSLGQAARESGAMVNDFVKTPAGTMIAAAIMYHYVGTSLVLLFGGCILMFVMCPAMLRAAYMVYVRASTVVVTYDTVSRFWGLYTKKVPGEIRKVDNWNDGDSDMIIIFVLAAIVTFVSGSVMLAHI